VRDRYGGEQLASFASARAAGESTRLQYGEISPLGEFHAKSDAGAATSSTSASATTAAATEAAGSESATSAHTRRGTSTGGGKKKRKTLPKQTSDDFGDDVSQKLATGTRVACAKRSVLIVARQLRSSAKRRWR
jgi:hypothetical protein